MKKTFKGFTLVECLVAMAILAIAGTLMAEIYAAVATRNNFNHFNNSSLTNQMAYVEKYTHSKTVTIASTHSGTTPPSYASNSGTNAYVKITNPETGYEYSFPVDIHILYSRDTHDVGSDETAYSKMYAEDDHNLRYKYILGHTS
ncbi:MAG: prepilin-type N-terminal cleavage/methylation domain-containing protein [Oscillospiraceae bacterium]|nr:prepilin-type N-terminal cleavage/methylation domain-containing protein [Oscillospiraceae bacterium]